MNHIFKSLFIFPLCFICLQGCFTFIKGGGKNAYKVDIDTANIDEASYRSLNISGILLDREYKQYWSEKPMPVPDFAGQSGFYSTFGKTITKEGYSVDVYIQYAQAERQSPAKRMHIWVINWTVGNLIPEIGREIDEVSATIYQQLVKKLGEQNVTLTRHRQPTHQ